MATLSDQDKQLLIESGLFDPEWYSKRFPDVTVLGLDPLEHFLRIGISFGRDPGPLFSGRHYLEQLKSRRRAEFPVLDYLRQGWKEQLNPHPLFDVGFYLNQNEDIRASGLDPLRHFRYSGGLEGREPHPSFPTSKVLERCPQLREAQRNPLEYYLSGDWSEDPCPEATAYLAGLHSNPRDSLIADPVACEASNKISPAYKARFDGMDAKSIWGWCVNTKNPQDIFEIDIFIDNTFYFSIKNKESRGDLKKAGLSEGLGGFVFPNPAVHLEDGKHSISLRFPNGIFSDPFEVVGKRLPQIRYSITDRIPHRPVTIVVPIHNAAEDLKICIDRLVAYTPEFAKILLINDCSTDPKIAEILSQQEQKPTIRILHNDVNLGFTRTVNRGIEEAGEDDVILLNSDARVTPRWLEGLLVAAYSAPRIATVTPMSDRAGAFSAPQIGNDNKLPEGVDEIAYARAFRRRSLGLYPRVPTGNGFCMYINRECIKSIGALDAEAFPRGYGEENDFCMRAQRAGWSNIIDDRTYVFHDRSKSFGESKTELLAAGRAVVDARYPEYAKAIRVFQTCERIAMARYRSRLALKDCIEKEGFGWIPRVLFVVSTQSGGTPQTNRDLMQQLSGVIESWVLRCDSRTMELSRMGNDGTTHIVQTHKLLNPVNPITHTSEEYDTVVSSWLQEFDFDLVHIRHLGWHGLSLPRLARQLGAKVIYSFHDFYALSSNFKLIDDTGVFLGSTFFEQGSVYRESLWPKDALPTPHGNWLTVWRERFQTALEYCDAFVTTADSARKLILDAMPRLPADRFVVIPHGRDFPKFERIRQKPKPGEPLRILVPGHINAVKGLEIIRALIEYDKAGKLEFHILGNLIGEPPIKGIVEMGVYNREEFAEKAQIALPHLGMIFSVWDETYCHTLTELWSVGLPAAVLDFPNVAQRVRHSGAGWVLDHKSIPKLYDDLLRLAFDESEYEKTEQALADWQAGYGLANSAAQMAAGYLNIYSDVLNEIPGKREPLSPHGRKRIGVVCPASADLRHAPGSTHIRIWEQTRNMVERKVTYLRMTSHMLIASAREKMLDGVIIQRNAIPKENFKKLCDTLNDYYIKYLEINDDYLDIDKISFDELIISVFKEKFTIKNDFLQISKSRKNKIDLSKRIAVCVHIYYIHRWEMIQSYLKNIHNDYDIYITCPVDIASNLESLSEKNKNFNILPVANLGMDVLPFLYATHMYELWRYGAVLKLHTKNDKTESGDVLGQILIEGVLGNPKLVDHILNEIIFKNSIGMVGSESMYRSAPKVMKPNRPNVEKILRAISTDWPSKEWGFFAGTMFWIRGELLEIVSKNYIQVCNQVFADKNKAVTGSDGHWAHAMERVFGLLPLISGRNVAATYPLSDKSGHLGIREVSFDDLSITLKSTRRSNYYVIRYKNLKEFVAICRGSEYFNETYYRSDAGALLPYDMDPATHYVLYGDVLGINPSSQFSTKDYLKNNPDVARLNPSLPSLIHYLKHGIKEGRKLSSVL